MRTLFAFALCVVACDAPPKIEPAPLPSVARNVQSAQSASAPKKRAHNPYLAPDDSALPPAVAPPTIPIATIEASSSAKPSRGLPR